MNDDDKTWRTHKFDAAAQLEKAIEKLAAHDTRLDSINKAAELLKLSTALAILDNVKAT